MSARGAGADGRSGSHSGGEPQRVTAGSASANAGLPPGQICLIEGMIPLLRAWPSRCIPAGHGAPLADLGGDGHLRGETRAKGLPPPPDRQRLCRMGTKVLKHRGPWVSVGRARPSRPPARTSAGAVVGPSGSTPSRPLPSPVAGLSDDRTSTLALWSGRGLRQPAVGALVRASDGEQLARPGSEARSAACRRAGRRPALPGA